MGVFNVKYTPRGEATEVTVDLTTLMGGLRLFSSKWMTNRATSITDGGNPYTVNFDQFIEYQCEFLRVQRSASVSNWGSIASMAAHISSGAEFVVEKDSDNVSDTTSSSLVAQSANLIPVASTTGFASGEIVYVEDADDPTKFEINECSGTSGGVQLTNGIQYSYVSGSIVRHFEYFPKCVALKPARFKERAAGQGSEVWDLDFTFRTVR